MREEAQQEKQSNQERLRAILAEGSLARRFALEYDEAKSSGENRDALKNVIEERLGEVRGEFGESENQVD